MSLAKLNPHIRYARAHTNLQVRKELSICYDCRLFYVHRGNGTLIADGKSYPFSDNTALYLPPRTRYRFLSGGNPEGVKILIFNFDLFDDYSHILESLNTASEAAYLPDRSPVYEIPAEFTQVMAFNSMHIYEPLKSCTRDFLTKPPYYRESASAVLKSCLLEMVRNAGKGPQSPIVIQVSNYVHEHYADSSLTNNKIAEIFGYHPYYLSQVFKSVTGKTLHAYLLYYRIRVAKNDLLTTEYDVETISWRCGFNSCSNFISQFKLSTGMTPKQYRSSNIGQIF